MESLCIPDPLGLPKRFFANLWLRPCISFSCFVLLNLYVLDKAKISLGTNFGNPNLRAKLDMLKSFITGWGTTHPRITHLSWLIPDYSSPKDSSLDDSSLNYSYPDYSSLDYSSPKNSFPDYTSNMVRGPSGPLEHFHMCVGIGRFSMKSTFKSCFLGIIWRIPKLNWPRVPYLYLFGSITYILTGPSQGLKIRGGW